MDFGSRCATNYVSGIRAFACVTWIAAASSLAASAQAAPIEYLVDGREVTANATTSYYTSWGSDYSWYDQRDTPDARFADFDGKATARDTFWGNSGNYEGGGEATQVSQLGPNRIQATGHAESDSDSGGGSGGDVFDEATYWYEEVWVDGSARSDFRIEFAVGAPTAIELWAMLSGSKDQSRISLVGYAGAGTFFDTDDRLGTEWIESYILPAGRYILRGEAEAIGYGDTADFALDLTATTVPEPGTLLLVGGGLVAFARRRHGGLRRDG